MDRKTIVSRQTSKKLLLIKSLDIFKKKPLFYLAVPFQNAITLIADLTKQYSIFCNASSLGSNQQVIWIQSVTKNPNQTYVTANNSRISFSNNGQKISFLNIFLSDQQYYACGVIQSGKLLVINSYYLYVRGKIGSFCF